MLLTLLVALSLPGEATAIDRQLAAFDRPDSPGCALAIVQDGRIAYRRGYGMANLEEAIPITSTTVFNIASVSKQFTAAAVLMLAKEKKLDLDADLRNYLPAFPVFNAKITPRHLIHHTSGLRENYALLQLAGWRSEDVILLKDALRLAYQQRELSFPTGSEHLYCNTGYMLMAELVRAVSGKSLRDFAAERIFKPLGMSSTEFRDDYRMVIARRAQSYIPKPGGGFQQAFNNSELAGQGNLHSTVEDLAKWDLAFYDGRVLGKDVVEAMLTRGKLNDGKTIPYACGLIHGSYRGLKTVGHNGAIAGNRTALLRFPDQRCTIIVLGNVSTFASEAMARRVADVWLADKLGKAATPQATASAEEANERVRNRLAYPEDYVGDFRSPELGVVYSVALEQGRLSLKHPRGADALRAAGDDSFAWQGQGAGFTLHFQRNGQGKVVGMRISSARARNIRFDRIELRTDL